MNIIDRFYLAANGTTFISGDGATAADKCLFAYSSGATGYATILSIQNNGEKQLEVAYQLEEI
jgi:hypothetical protein